MNDAYIMAKELSCYRRDVFTSFSRFGDDDFDGYYKKRLRTEEWLYDSFLALGGKPQNEHPLYFVLGESNYLNNWYEDCITTRILLDLIDVTDISFTFGDSMSRMDSEDRKNPFNKETLINFISETSSEIHMFLDDLNRKNRYIEVQLWNDRYVKDFL
jgi:hypothetical protein